MPTKILQIIFSPQYSARVPLYTPQPGYQYMPSTNYQTMYYQGATGSLLRGHMVPQSAPRAGPQQREKRLIEIKDPTTGRDLTAELCQRPQSADSSAEEETQVSHCYLKLIYFSHLIKVHFLVHI